MSASGRTIAWFHPVSGIAGDMALGALLDAGADLDYVRSAVAGLGVPGWELSTKAVTRGGLAATKAVVDVGAGESGHANHGDSSDGDSSHGDHAGDHDHSHDHSHDGQRRWREIDELLTKANFPTERLRQRAQQIFQRLAIAEGEVHGIDPADVHFHEVGALDAIVDIVGTAAALESLGVDEVGCGPVSVGKGQIIAAHGALPNPAPAVVRLLEGFEITGVDVDVELTTPTGAAILAALAGETSPLPSLTIRASGYGAGTTEMDNRPNVTQVIIGEQLPAQRRTRSSAGLAGDANAGANASATTETVELTELSTNLDDVTGEVLAHAITALIDAGALDAWAAPIVMKKGRPAHCLHVLCQPAMTVALTQQVISLTATLGVRAATVYRTAVPRREVLVEVEGVPVAVKIGPNRAKAEWDDVRAAAEQLGISPMEVAERAERAATE